MPIKNDKLRIFLRRNGQYIAGGLMAAAFIGVMILGMNATVRIGEDYISTKKVQEKIWDKVTGDSETSSDAGGTVWDKYYKLNELGLRYEAHIEELDGEMFIYSVELDRAVDDSTIKSLDEQIIKKCGKPTEDNNYGEISIEKTGEKTLQVILDLGSAYDTKAITGIFKALDDIDGVTKAVVNSDSNYKKQFKAPDADAKTEEESSRAWAEYAEKLKQHFDSLGLHYPVECEALGSCFTLYISFENKPDADIKTALDEKLGKLAGDDKRSWTVADSTYDSENCVAFIVTADSYEYVQPEEAALCDSMLKLLDSDFKGIEKVRII